MKTKDIEIPSVESIMNRRVEAFEPDLPIAEAIQLLLRRGYSGAPVVDGEGKPIGVLSEHDCVGVLAESLYEDWPTGKVGDHMVKDPVTVDVGQDVLAAARAFAKAKLRRLPVVREGKLVGLLTRRDLMRALDDLRRSAGKQHEPTTYELIAARR
ncbi:CBS domain-containing protein [Pseudenhygromyxa sp. WMMC2535]|uniref:CBS domain-containing protein n=1 Tax=Pseudenhygromyxa sp. WMMC2535 TaxID=2712867 RepID=UPI001557444F|nr:CBS domain-containing protein [Pseudenhygromyxa sp. WMMC2535]NVB40651.1 CBS domain-containing protein [Pseudenhygromyxa sp. WMMC2535]